MPMDGAGHCHSSSNCWCCMFYTPTKLLNLPKLIGECAMTFRRLISPVWRPFMGSQTPCLFVAMKTLAGTRQTSASMGAAFPFGQGIAVDHPEQGRK